MPTLNINRSGEPDEVEITLDYEDWVRAESFHHEWFLDGNNDVVALGVSGDIQAKVYLYQFVLEINNKTSAAFINGDKLDFSRSNLMIV